MKFFYIADHVSASGFKEVHDQDCPAIPDMLNRKYLGPFNNHTEALRRIKKTDDLAGCCIICCTTLEDKVNL
jgi:hypothetical protein